MNIFNNYKSGNIFENSEDGGRVDKLYKYQEIIDIVIKETDNTKVEIWCKLDKDKQYLQELRFHLDLNFSPYNIKGFSNCDKNKEIIVSFV